MKSIKSKQFSHDFYLWFVATAIFALYFLLSLHNRFSALLPMVDFTAPRPYVYRVFTPLIIRGISTVTHLPIPTAALMVMYLSMLGFVWSMLALLRVFLSSRLAHHLALFAPVGLIPFFFEQRHIYDLPTLFLFTLAYYYLSTDRMRGYMLAFTLATLSKETALFLIFFFAIQFMKLDRVRFFRLLIGQVIIFTVIRLFLMLVFKDNPGSVVEIHLTDHLTAALNHPASVLIPVLTLIGLLCLGLRSTISEAEFARNAILSIGAPILVLYLLFGKPCEIRVFLEVYPALFLLMAQYLFFHYQKFRQRHGLATE